MLTYMASGRRIGTIGQVAAPFFYRPDLAPVGHADSYFPRDVEADAQALNFLGFLSDVAELDRQSSTGTQAGDIARKAGAWDSIFRASIAAFQHSKGLIVDTWVGPQTRTALAAAVAFKNANPGALPPPPPPGGIPVNPGRVPAQPAVLPGVRPATAADEDNTLTYVGIGVGVLALGGLAWYAFT